MDPSWIRHTAHRTPADDTNVVDFTSIGDVKIVRHTMGAIQD